MNGGRPRLRRQIGLLDAIGISLGAIIGAGVFVVLGEAAGAAGAALPLAVLLAAGAAFCNALSAVELGVSHPLAGGPYEFGYELLSPVVGFVGGWVYLYTYFAASTTYALSFAAYLQPLLPGLPLHAVTAALILFAVAANIAGVRQAGRINDLLVSFKILVLAVFVIIGLIFLPDWNLNAFRPLRFGGLLQASALVFFAYSGFASPVVVAGEVRDPAHTLPRAVTLSLALSTILYLTVAVVGLGLVGAGGLAASPAPLREALQPTQLGWAMALVSLGGLVATTDVLLTGIWGLSRLIYAMARRGDLPAILGRLDARGVPRNAILLIGVITIALSLAVSFGPALAAGSLGHLTYYGIMDVAALRLGPEQRQYTRAISLAGLVSCGVLAFSLPISAILGLAAVIGIGLIYYYLHCRAGRGGPHADGRGADHGGARLRR